MDCPSINRLRLSGESKKAIIRIKRIPGLANKLAGSLAASKIVNLFASPTPPAVTLYSIQTTDWLSFSQAMFSIPEIARVSIAREAQNQWTNAQFINNHEEAKFW
jgi:hypothetical protein